MYPIVSELFFEKIPPHSTELLGRCRRKPVAINVKKRIFLDSQFSYCQYHTAWIIVAFVISFEIGKYKSSNFVLLQNHFGYFESFAFLYKF